VVGETVGVIGTRHPCESSRSGRAKFAAKQYWQAVSRRIGPGTKIITTRLTDCVSLVSDVCSFVVTTRFS